MDAPGPPDHADEMRPAQASLPPPPISSERSGNMLEDKVAHPAKRMWNSDADESVETAKRARLTESAENRLNDNSSNEKLSHINAAPPVLNQDIDTNGDENGDHLSRDASNGSLESNSPLLNNTEGPSLQDDSVDETRDASPKEVSGLNSNNEEESMDVESNSVESSALTEKPSGVVKDRTVTSTGDVEDSDRKSPSEISNQMDLKGLTGEEVETESEAPACVPVKEDTESSASEKKTSLSEQDSETNKCEENPSRTEDCEVSTKLKPDLENGKDDDDDKEAISPKTNVAKLKDMIKERFKDQLDKKSTDCDKKSKEEGINAKDSESKMNKDTSRSSSPQDDVIVLSDDEMDEATGADDDASSIDTGPFSPPPDDDPLSKLSEEELGQRDKVIRELQEELRTEEGKLLLLKKLRQSQQQPVQVVPKEGTATNAISTASVAPTMPKPTMMQSITTALPLLLRTTQGSKVQIQTHLHQQQQQQQQLHHLKQLQQFQQQQQKAGGASCRCPSWCGALRSRPCRDVVC